MRSSRRRGATEELNPWPGYVDALSTLLMVIIFVLLVFVLAQAFLSVALTGRDRALDRLNRQVAELTEMLSLERGRAGEQQQANAGLNRDLQAANGTRDALNRELAGLHADQARAQAERDALKAERDRLSARLADAELQAQSALARSQQLQSRIAETAGQTDAAGQETAIVAGQLADARRQLAQLRAAQLALQAELDHTTAADRDTLAARALDIASLAQKLEATQTQLDQTSKTDQDIIAARTAALADLDRQLAAARAELAQTVTADRATIAARVADLARLQAQLDALQKQVADAATQASTDAQQRQALVTKLDDEQKLADASKARVVVLDQQLIDLRDRLEQVSAALRLAQADDRDKDVQITGLSSKLNAALASKVEELQRYRSEFFGKLSQVLQNRQDVQVVGDRFVFQSEVLFPVGSAELTASGQEQIRKLATTLKQIAGEIPTDVNWLLRVDGHADKQPRGRGDVGNWDLSAQRAISVVKLLVDEGIPADRLAATGFGEYQPLDQTDSPAAYARNRRIELRLTDR